MWSRIIRASNGGRCWLLGADHVRCGGQIQAAHAFTRGHHSTRHELWGGLPTCAGHHCYYTHHDEQWKLLLRARWGDEVYQQRYAKSQIIARPDYAVTLAELQKIAGQL